MGFFRRRLLRPTATALAVFGLAAIAVGLLHPTAEARPKTHPTLPTSHVVGGTLTFSFHPAMLKKHGWTLASNGAIDGDRPDTQFSFPLSAGEMIRADSPDAGTAPGVSAVWVETGGALLLSGAQERVVIGNFRLGVSGDGVWRIYSRLDPSDEVIVLLATEVQVEFDEQRSRLRIIGDLLVSQPWAEALGDASLAGLVMGTFEVEATVRAGEWTTPDEDPVAPTVGRTTGADVIVGSIHDARSYGTDPLSKVAAFALGTTSCNAGDVPLSWFGVTPNHPVIAQNMFRLLDGRFEQIGMSWVKHGFATANSDACGFGCTRPPELGRQLGVGCSDPYSASLNGQQDNLGPRSLVNPHTGVFPYPWTAPDPAPLIGRRLQIHTDDLDPALNAGARYFAEGHYVHPEDSAAGNQNNNASYRLVRFTQDGPDYVLTILSATNRGSPGIRAWRHFDNTVSPTTVQIPGDGLLIMSEKTTDLGNGFWHYEYALQNLNSDRAVRSFGIPIEPGTAVTNIGFHDVESHSGEPFDGEDWPAIFENGLLVWSTDSYSANPNANALRWGTLFNFRFDADVGPAETIASIGLFKPGLPALLAATTQGPVGTPAVCGNGITQAGEECDPPNGITCDDACLRIPTCGDDILDPGEECEPPDFVHCDAFCRILSNNLCGDALPLCPGTTEGDTTTANKEGSTSCGNSSTSPDVWYRYTPATDGAVKLETCGSPFDTVLSVHDGCPGTAANESACNDDSCFRESRITIPVFADETYVIRVSGFGGERGSFSLTVTGPDCAAEPPGNDECDFALPIGEGTTVVDTSGATDSDPLEVGQCAVDADAWYCYQPTCTGAAIVSLCDSNFDTAVAVYEGCECPAQAAAFACNNDACLSQSEVTWTVNVGDSYLIRVGGRAGAVGSAILSIDCEGVGDPIRGGQMWDRWWVVNGAAEPIGEHPLYPAVGQQDGVATFRCKECHGWDYQGAAGAYGSGPHFTGIPGVWETQLPRRDLFDLIKSDVVQNGHGFGDFGMSNQDVWDLVEFLQSLVIDTDEYIDETGIFIGDELQGAVNYASGGALSCEVCHGADGTQINFGSRGELEWVGTIAAENPWELLHKVRFGPPGSNMPSWLAEGGSNQGAADIGRYAQFAFPAVCTNNDHCDDGLFCSGAESCVDDECVDGSRPCVAQACDDDNDVCTAIDQYRGGRLWDKWWVENGAPTPVGEHPLYPEVGEQIASATFRCKECHGWDYKGADGAYAGGSHFTGIPGVFGSTMSAFDLFDIVMSDTAINGHSFASFGLTERDGWDLAAFLQSLVIDTDGFIDRTAKFIGDEAAGEEAYTSGGLLSCTLCHGLDGTAINFGTPQAPEWVGTVATYNPWELLHKVRVGQPGAPMPSWLANGGSDQGAADIGLHAQVNFPVDCLADEHCDDGAFCTGAEFCANTFCMPGDDPCVGLLCDEDIDLCMTGSCEPPSVESLGCRYIEVVPADGTEPVAFLVTNESVAGEIPCLFEYIQQDHTLGPDPVFLTPAEWESVVVSGEAIQPQQLYDVRAVCGDLTKPDPSLPDSAETRLLADVDGNLSVNFNDVFLIIKAFQADFTLVTLEEADLEPCDPNGIANFADVLVSILAFQGTTFGELGCPAVCP